MKAEVVRRKLLSVAKIQNNIELKMIKKEVKVDEYKREVSRQHLPKAKARQSRFYKDRETSAVLRINDSAVLCPNIGAEYQRPSAFLFL